MPGSRAVPGRAAARGGSCSKGWGGGDTSAPTCPPSPEPPPQPRLLTSDVGKDGGLDVVALLAAAAAAAQHAGALLLANLDVALQVGRGGGGRDGEKVAALKLSSAEALKVLHHCLGSGRAGPEEFRAGRLKTKLQIRKKRGRKERKRDHHDLVELVLVNLGALDHALGEGVADLAVAGALGRGGAEGCRHIHTTRECR